MTKAKARQRAKAKAAQKVKKRAAIVDQPAQKIRPEQFGPRDNSISSPRAQTNVRSHSGAKRGAARSR